LLNTKKDETGRIIAYCEWRLVGQSGYEVPNGKYVYVHDLWVHEDYRHQHLVNEIINDIMTLVPQAEYCYFQRKDYNERVRLFTRSQMERRRMKNHQKVEV
jgi:ribosomal protein S18 acetylase RimI-like enzyme